MYSKVARLTDYLEDEGKVGVLIGGSQSEYGGVDLGVRWDQNHSHVGRDVEARTCRTRRPGEETAQTDPRLEPFFRHSHSESVQE